MKKYLDCYIPLLMYFLTNSISILLLIDRYSYELIFSFIITNTSVFILLYKVLKEKNCYYEVSMIIYYITFFIFAPIIQLYNGNFPIKYPIRENQVIMANLINSLFIISYSAYRFISFSYTKKERKKIFIKVDSIKIIWLIVIIISIVFIPVLIKSILYRTHISFGNSSVDLIVNKFLFFIPVILFYYYLNEYSNTHEKKQLILLFISLIIVIVFKNPFTEKRNVLGPIYLAAIMFLLNKKIDTRKFFELFLVIFVVGFPLTAVFTHSSLGIKGIINSSTTLFNVEEVFNQFKEMHFDAFENLCVIIEYTENYGFMSGLNVIAAFLFFIPRMLWTSKPLSSGKIVGNYLIDRYGFGYNNLSCTITAEAYLSGGFLGILILSFLLSIIGKKVASYIELGGYNSIVSWYIIIQLIFLLRGDLMNGIAYLVGGLLSIYILPKVINSIVTKNKQVYKINANKV